MESTLVLLGLPVSCVLFYSLLQWANRAPFSYVGRLALFAKLVGGQVVTRSTVDGHVIWNRRGLPFYIYERRMIPGRWTIISVGYDGIKLPLYQIRPDREPVPLLPPRFRSALRTGNAAFDQRFILRFPDQPPEPPPLALRRFQDLLQLLAPAAPFLEVHENRVRLYLPGVLRGDQCRRSAIEFGCQLLEAVLHDKGHELTSKQLRVVDVLTAADGVKCRICGEAIHSVAVRCLKCKTPHHDECWDYVGSCAVFGCGCTQRG